MRIPMPNELKAIGEVLVTWGFWIIVYGAITMFVGLVIITIVEMFNKQSVKYLE